MTRIYLLSTVSRRAMALARPTPPEEHATVIRQLAKALGVRQR